MLQLLESYRREECLWNPMLRDYKNAQARARAIKRILDDLKEEIGAAGDGNLPTETNILAKIRNIRSTYHKELRKIEQSERSGAGSADVYKPKLFWFPLADSFLRQCCRPTPSSSNLKVSDELYCTQMYLIIKILDSNLRVADSTFKGRSSAIPASDS